MKLEGDKEEAKAYVVVINVQGAPDLAIEGVWLDELDAQRAVDDIREEDCYEMDDVYIVEMPLDYDAPRKWIA